MDDAHGFMIEEYRQIVKAYADLHTQKSDLLKLYFTIIGIGASAVTLFGQITKGELEYLRIDTSTAIASLILLLFLLGLAILFSLVGIRTEMILYVRTINKVRGFFVEKNRMNSPNPKIPIENFLVLPTTDRAPPFFGSYSTSFFWIFNLIALINSALLGFGLYISTIEKVPTPYVVFLAFVLQWSYYCGISQHKETSHEGKVKAGRKFVITPSWSRPLSAYLKHPTVWVREDDSIYNDGEDFTELSLTICNTTDIVQELKPMSIQLEGEGGNIVVTLLSKGNYRIGPGRAGEQTWKYRLESEEGLPGNYKVLIYNGKERFEDTFTMTIYGRQKPEK